MRSPEEAVAGDTLCLQEDWRRLSKSGGEGGQIEPLRKVEPPLHMVFAGAFPADGAQVEHIGIHLAVVDS